MILKYADFDDLKFIIAIYNEYIDTTITMDGECATIESRTEWFHKHDSAHPIICALIDDKIIAWFSLSKWSEKAGYSKTVELSIYVAKNYHKQGIGILLIQKAINIAKENNHHCIISRIDANNIISLNIHKKFGFNQIGIMKEIGFKFGAYIDVHILQLIL